MTAEIKALRPGGKLTKETLIQLGTDPQLERFMVVCIWDDGMMTTGWSHDMTNGQLVYGSASIASEVEQVVFPHRHQAEDIIY